MYLPEWLFAGTERSTGPAATIGDVFRTIGYRYAVRRMASQRSHLGPSFGVVLQRLLPERRVVRFLPADGLEADYLEDHPVSGAN